MPTISNTFCVKCQTFLIISDIGVAVEEIMGDGQPYKLWTADLFECPTCGMQVITRFGSEPICEHFENDYDSTKKRYAEKELLYQETLRY
jgi:hypothetical protein